MAGRAMSGKAKDPMARSVHVLFPNGDRQYWLTFQELTPGSRIRHNGDEWIVVETRTTSDGAIDLRVRAAEPAEYDRDGSAKRDMDAWSAPQPRPGPPGPAREVWPVGAPEVAAHMLPRDDPEAT